MYTFTHMKTCKNEHLKTCTVVQKRMFANVHVCKCTFEKMYLHFYIISNKSFSFAIVINLKTVKQW